MIFLYDGYNKMERKPLEKLASPEQLDRLLVVVRIPGWIALFCLALIFLAIFVWAIFGTLPVTTSGKGIFFDPNSIEVIQSASKGIVKKVVVDELDRVNKGATLLELQTETEEMTILAPSDGRVLTVDVLPGEVVEFGQTLLYFQTSYEDDLIYSFFSIEEGDQIKPGMQAHIGFDSVRTEIYGKMEGVVKQILPFAANMQGDILRGIPSKSLREYLESNGATVIILIAPTPNPKTPSGYQWTTPEGPPYQIPFGSVAEVKVTLEQKRPLSYLIPLGDE